MKIKSLILAASSVLLLASCGAKCPEVAGEPEEIALGASVLGNWEFKASENGATKDEVKVYVDSETKFHFTLTRYYTDFAPSSFTYEGQITSVEAGVGSCFAVFTNAYLNHGKADEATTAAASAQFKSYRSDKIPEIYDGEGQFQIQFHRLSANTGYITTQDGMDLSFGVFDACDALGVSAAQ